LISTKTVLGAGASNPYGLPLGSELYALAIDDFSSNTQIRNEFFNVTAFNQEQLQQFILALRFSGLTSASVAWIERVGWVERSETHHAARRPIDGFRKGSTHPTRCALN
jgi:hypothetical protein